MMWNERRGRQHFFMDLWDRKESFHTLSIEELLKYEEQLQEIYLMITFQKEEVRYYSSKYDIPL